MNPFVEPLRQADKFYKNVYLMFRDIIAEIREKTLAATVTDCHGPESVFWLNNESSEYKHLFIFEYAGVYRFIQMLVKTNEGLLRGQGQKYKAICAKLDFDPVVPLLLTYGVFRPRNIVRFTTDGNWLRRKWANNAVLLEIPDEIELADPNSYDWNQAVRVGSREGTDSQYCEDATVYLRQLTEIRDQSAVAALVDELIQLSPHPAPG